jgi:hypothetical protein
MPLHEICAWVGGFWDFGLRERRRWNDLQNVPRDINRLADYLVSQYRFRTAEDDRPGLQVAAG